MFSKRHRRKPERVLAIAAAAALTALLVAAAPVAAGDGAKAGPYSPYRFLIGEWDLASDAGGPPIGILRVRWGPNQSYMWLSSSFLVAGAERPHFEGLLVWNGVRKNLDMLVTMDLEHGLVQEQGSMVAEPDGTVVRQITATYSEGARPMGQPVAGPEGTTLHFRQTFKALGADRISTRVLRETPNGWAATFPGSDHLVMIRRTKA